ncbi:hypothetical protein GVN15_20965 [Pseudomonas putida]|uniref:hypothetical protein n=1 Tax=Pseudomonas putida TaxID=303 RepID=UPI0013769EEE|nr:hypothetical protein [Pseudomonas putida]NBA83112.1 hypothetical protein [Pseudomonas putida]
MSDSRKVYRTFERVPKDYLRFLADHKPHRDTLGLADLVVDPAMLADATSGLVFRKFAIEESGGPTDPVEPLTLKLPLWDKTEQDEVRIEHSRDGTTWTMVYENIADFRGADTPDPYPAVIPKNQDRLRLDGIHYFRSYIVNSDGDHSASGPYTLIFDRNPPYSHFPPAKFPDISVVTDASLNANGDNAELVLPAYTSWADGDEVLVYWMNRIPDKVEDLDLPIVTEHTTGSEQTLSIPGEKIRKVGDGGVYVLYRLVDKAQNFSALSVWTSVPVALGELPATFDIPLVPLATAPDTLIDQADAYLGVQVWVPWKEQMKDTDKIVVTWDGKELTPEAVGSVPGEHIKIMVPTDVMLGAYGTSKGPKATKVSYVLMRGTYPVGGAEIDIFVDFETMDPGGPYPEWPLPIHPDLNGVVVKGRGGTSKENELDTSDADKPADLHVKLYDFVEEKDKIEFYWAGEWAAEYEVLDTDAPGDTISVVVPWDIIKAGGNSPDLPVDYVVTRPGVHNPMRSTITPVSVDAITIIPVVATFEHLVNGRVTCASIRATNGHPDGAAVEVLIPDLTEYYQFSEFTQIKAEWWVYRGETDDQGCEIIDEVTLEAVLDINADNPITGFTWRIPYLTNVLPTDEGLGGEFRRSRANVRYTLMTAKGDIASPEAKVLLSFRPPEGYCDPAGS